ncbi:unnamed protein product, partial [Pylaiella littoralis]
MSGDRASSGGRKGAHGHRKRSRPFYPGSGSRIAPRNPFGQRRAPASERSHHSSSSSSRSSHGGFSSRRSSLPLGRRSAYDGAYDDVVDDNFVDDVLFDVAPKDMCSVDSSQGPPRRGGEENSVVLEELRSLGSVLAGGKGGPGGGATGTGTGGRSADGVKGSTAGGASSFYSGDGSGSNCSSLLTRWLQPTAGS